ncbi:hypothetical protein SAMN02746089_01876 [Caldanaerobius fijiensis DSM 17918]|uniref:Uncharacterized protein n=1 Tax=Caldanaerobius fijiensis DSM 17918 TaxID=1121256 RepID=A0A1M5BI63_9THEO|nr:hypothetical protein [Caldanaerobius fijiensis]SHF42181.1 hypothetical protein SAMN02746089_01876 [Caldanaerobius fijiensis DSM 17918]
MENEHIIPPIKNLVTFFLCAKIIFSPLLFLPTTLFRVIDNNVKNKYDKFFYGFFFIMISSFLYGFLINLIVLIFKPSFMPFIKIQWLILEGFCTFTFIFLVIDVIYAAVWKKVLNLKLLWLYATSRLSLIVTLYILLDKKHRQEIKLPKNFIYIEPHYQLHTIKKLNNFSKFTLKKETYKDLIKIINNFPNKDVVFFAHTPMQLDKILSHFSLSSNIKLLGPYPAKTPPENSIKILGKKSPWYIYLIVKTKELSFSQKKKAG